MHNQSCVLVAGKAIEKRKGAIGMRITDRNDWFDLWFDDKQSMINIMISNMQADLNAGYNYFGNSIVAQRQAIELYKQRFDEEINAFHSMTEKEVNRWCYYDMKKRGVIE